MCCRLWGRRVGNNLATKQQCTTLHLSLETSDLCVSNLLIHLLFKAWAPLGCRTLGRSSEWEEPLKSNRKSETAWVVCICLPNTSCQGTMGGLGVLVLHWHSFFQPLRVTCLQWVPQKSSAEPPLGQSDHSLSLLTPGPATWQGRATHPLHCFERLGGILCGFLS